MRRLNRVGLALTILFLALPLHAPLAQQSQSVRSAASAAAPSAYFPAERSAAERITAAEMKEILYYIASDEMLGRDTPSPGLDATAKYIADRLAKAKLKPMGDKGTYFQHITLSKTAVDRARRRSWANEPSSSATTSCPSAARAARPRARSSTSATAG